ncbi:hypothetical protein CspHIS471_0510300 [Cutaneotrichosporon sp. HIS471]|nr:hypothetical protein CspHIS471_0510300 [Cutaneotrichosporon sp. HIS471]
MPHLTTLMAERKAPFHTFEFFPPRTAPGVANLLDRIQRLASPPLNPPLAVSVTWGAGGSTAERSIELAESIAAMGLEVILHLTCTNMPRAKVDTALERARALGITNLLALRGDAPRPDEYREAESSQTIDEFNHADDLVRYIRVKHGAFFCIGVAGYPTTHPDAESAESDMHWLKNKCDAGADYIITQLFYDVGQFETWVAACRAAGISQPIIPGVMPIQSYSSFRRLINLTKCVVPEKILRDLEPIKSNDAAVKQYGAQLATDMVKDLIGSKLVPGVHFCTLNLERSVRTILENVEWTLDHAHPVHGSPRARANQLISDQSLPTVEGLPISIRPSDAAQLAQWTLKRAAAAGADASKLPPIPGVIPGVGEDPWDEFPNGRFTDVRSPAYGEIDGWGSGLKITPAQALREWGAPTTAADLSTVFQACLRGDERTPTTPFCDLPLSPESSLILPHLLALNSADKAYWTVGSQPAVDAARSDDPMHGWGPVGGYVFQKAFVEFFVPLSEVHRLEAKLLSMTPEGADGGPGQSLISMYAANRNGDYGANTEKDAVNAVTWGVFPGQEIQQSTIIEEISFLAWKQEAFEIWQEWARLYPRDSPARKYLDSVADEWWLVSLIHHDYKDKDALWRFLLE